MLQIDHNFSTFLVRCFLFCRYIYRELVAKNVLPSSCLPIILVDWIDVNSNFCVYTGMQLARFPFVHLVASGWYLDCSRAFVLDVEKTLYNRLASFVPEVIELEDEPKEDNQAPSSNEKEVAQVKGKSKGRKVAAHASSQTSTRSFIKALVPRTTAPATTVIGSSTATLSPLPPIMLPLLLIAGQPSHQCLARGRLLHWIHL